MRAIRSLVGAVVLAGLPAACNSTDTTYGSYMFQQAQLTRTAANDYVAFYAWGVWDTQDYTTCIFPTGQVGLWAPEQSAAVAEAALGAIPASYLSGNQQLLAEQANDRQIAIATVNAVIANHQFPSGSSLAGAFDAGQQSCGSGGVDASFWGMAEAQIAITLWPYLDSATQQKWIASLEAYADYLTNTQLGWWANGNVVLRYTLIPLVVYKLTGNSIYLNEYQKWLAFLSNPSSYNWVGRGWVTDQYGGYYTESSCPSSNLSCNAPGMAMWCTNGLSPCDGWDPYYTMVQLRDVIFAYSISGNTYWKQKLLAEYSEFTGRGLLNTSTDTLNASNGSRKSISSQLFEPPIWEVLDEHNLAGADDSAWAAQQSAMRSAIAYGATMANPGPNLFEFAQDVALALIDAERTG